MAKKKLILRVVWGIVLVLFLIVSVMGVLIYRKIYTPNIFSGKKETQYLYIPTGTDFNGLVKILSDNKVLINESSFRWTAHQMKYDLNVKSGKYKLQEKMSNKELISLL